MKQPVDAPQTDNLGEPQSPVTEARRLSRRTRALLAGAVALGLPVAAIAGTALTNHHSPDNSTPTNLPAKTPGTPMFGEPDTTIGPDPLGLKSPVTWDASPAITVVPTSVPQDGHPINDSPETYPGSK
jgi:hypothetical protein